MPQRPFDRMNDARLGRSDDRVRPERRCPPGRPSRVSRHDSSRQQPQCLTSPAHAPIEGLPSGVARALGPPPALPRADRGGRVASRPAHGRCRDIRQRTVLRLARARHRPHRERHRLLPARGAAVRAVTAPARVAPPRGSGAPSGRTPRGVDRALDGVLTGAARARRTRAPRAAGRVRHRDDREPRARLPRDPPRRRASAQRLDDPRLCDRARRRHPGVHGARGIPAHRLCRCADVGGADGRGLGDQPRGGGVCDPPARHRCAGRSSAFRPIRPRCSPPIMRGMTSPLRSVWDAPAAAPPPPRRVWRDWVLVAVLPLLAVLEAAARPDVPWRWLWAVVLAALVPTLLWRRTHPLLMLAIAFGVGSIVTLVTGGDAQLVTTAYMLLLVYAAVRWGTGRAMLFAGVILLASSALSFAYGGPSPIADIIGGLAVLITTASLGVAFRWRAAARARELDRVKLSERELLARDLHDTVAHHVSAIAIQAQAGTAVAATDPDAAARVLRVIESEASRTLAEMRSIVRVLRREDAPATTAPSPGIAELRNL